jgi:hypothetical protein
MEGLPSNLNLEYNYIIISLSGGIYERRNKRINRF